MLNEQIAIFNVIPSDYFVKFSLSKDTVKSKYTLSPIFLEVWHLKYL